jgi:uncharacterized protein YbjQ (UPF0145 family)
MSKPPKDPREGAAGQDAPGAGQDDSAALAEQSARAEESAARVEQGGIPLEAEERLRELAEHGGSFTSDLSVADYALCHQLGLRPLSQVMGSSIYQVGYQTTPWPSMLGGSFMYELDSLSNAWNDVRGRALGRLGQEAGHVGADAVIGVELRTGQHDWAENAIEYLVIGTAVSHESAPAERRDRERPAHEDRKRRPRAGAPVLTELSVADYVKLARAGIEPLGIVAWSSVFFVAGMEEMEMMSGRMGGIMFNENQEMRGYTQGVYSARESVMARMTAQAAQLGASGVIGTRIEHRIGRVSLGGGRYQRGGLMVTFHAIGTAIREAAKTSPYAPKPILDLTDTHHLTGSTP